MGNTALCMVALALVGCTATVSQSGVQAERTAPGAVILVRTPRHVQAALKSGVALLGGEGVRVATVQIIVCDEAVRALTEDPDLRRAIENAQARGVHTAACGMSLEHFGIDRKDLPPSVPVVPNGIIETLRLQSVGFLSVEL